MTDNKRESYGTSGSVASKYVAANGTAAVGIPGKEFDSNTNGDYKGHPRLSDEAHHSIHPKSYFTEFTARKALVYLFATLYVVGCGIVSVAEMFMSFPCPADENPIEYPNPDFNGSKCLNIRQPMLLGLTQTECSFGRRLVMSILMGGIIGWERRQADRPAGIRTMSLVSLGSCLFTINSAFAFREGPQEWDASRISAAIPSGVGFLGAGLIFKKTDGDENNMVVHGLTTAASLWLSAAVGIACGGELYFAATFGTCLMMLLLRFGPRGSDADGDDDDDDEEEDEDEELHGYPGPIVGESDSLRLEIPPGGQSSATMIFRNSDGSQNLPPGLQDPQPQISMDASTKDGYTVTGESIETSSAVETTPMLPQPTGDQQLLQVLTQQRATPTLGQSSKPNSQHQLSKRKTPSKSNRIRKRQSKANLGSIV